jgi:hypothetical protein
VGGLVCPEEWRSEEQDCHQLTNPLSHLPGLAARIIFYFPSQKSAVTARLPLLLLLRGVSGGHCCRHVTPSPPAPPAHLSQGGVGGLASSRPAYGAILFSAGNLRPAMGARNQVGIGLSYRPASLCSLAPQFQTRFWNRFLAP